MPLGIGPADTAGDAIYSATHGNFGHAAVDVAITAVGSRFPVATIPLQTIRNLTIGDPRVHEIREEAKEELAAGDAARTARHRSAGPGDRRVYRQHPDRVGPVVPSAGPRLPGNRP